MKDRRLIGKTIEKAAVKKGVSPRDIAEATGTTEREIEQVIAGRLMYTFPKMEQIADYLDVSVDTLVKGDEQYYAENAVSCMKRFQHDKNREMILDLIYDYLDVLDGVDNVE